MKNSVTKFDFEAAFKALDEIEIPKAEKGIKENRAPLTEIFSKKTKTDSLIEDYYNVNDSAELEDAKEARDAEIAKAKLARIEKIVDLDAESPEDLLTSYVGKLIMQCPQCMTLFYKDPEDIEESEDDPSTVNINEVCQHCGNDTGYMLIGKVGEVTPEEAENYEAAEDTSDDEVEEVDVDSTEDDTEDATESEEDFDLDDIELDLEIEEEPEEEKTEEAFKTTYLGTPLTEDIITEEVADSKDTLEEDAFSALLDSEEFKTPISDSEVRTMLATTESVQTEEPVEDSAETKESEELEEGVFDKLTDKISKSGKLGAALTKPMGDIGTANWLLENSLIDYNKEPDESNKKFTSFLVLCFEPEYADGSTITKAPKWNSEKLIAIQDSSKLYSDYKGAEAYAKAQSALPEVGAALIYLFNKKDTDDLSYLSLYFKGSADKAQSQIDDYYKEVSNCYALSKKYDKNMKKAGKYEVTEESLDKTFADVDEIDEKPLEECIAQALVKLDEEVESFKLIECAYQDNKFTISGAVTKKNNETSNITYSFTEAFNTGKSIKLRGICESTTAKNSFIVSGNIDKTTKTFITEAFAYKQIKDNKILEGNIHSK